MSALRPLERRILRLKEEGLDPDEIGRRFKRSADHVQRIIEYARLPGRKPASSVREGLRALERRVLELRRQGFDHAEIGRRFGRSAGHIRRVEGLARYKQSLQLLRG